MVRRGFIGGVVTVAAAIVAMGAVTAQAIGPDAKLQASTYNTKLVQAFDECTSPVTILFLVPACDPANVTTDGTAFSTGKILVKSKAGSSQVLSILKSSGAVDKKALAAKNLRTRIVMRVTRSAGTPKVTWEDQTLDCPIFAVPANGNMVQKVSLANCGLGATLATDSSNKEIVAASIIDSDTDKPVAVPGVRKKP